MEALEFASLAHHDQSSKGELFEGLDTFILPDQISDAPEAVCLVRGENQKNKEINDMFVNYERMRADLRKIENREVIQQH